MKTRKVRGRVIKIEGSTVFLITPDGEFIKTDVHGTPPKIGEEITADAEKPAPAALKILSLAAAAVIALFIIIQPMLTALAEPAYYLHIDINPSIELQLSKDLTVKEAKALNKEGQQILNGVKIKALYAADALENIIKEAAELGYLGPDRSNTVLISIIKNEVLGYSRTISAEEIRTRITQCLKEYNLEGMVGIADVELKLRETAIKKGVSVNSILLDEKAGLRTSNKKLDINRNKENLSKIYSFSMVKFKTKSSAAERTINDKKESGKENIRQKNKSTEIKNGREDRNIKASGSKNTSTGYENSRTFENKTNENKNENDKNETKQKIPADDKAPSNKSLNTEQTEIIPKSHVPDDKQQKNKKSENKNISKGKKKES
ncbi:MAG TPA: hypothetical protein DEA47_00950 [Peptococcaceae bacterium]|nr:MAG: hypothetical protein XD50_1601 [Clostridia bacterium 41_269]HBT19932.1 hypothetical protein [Peptococcaceae bacterium]